MYPDTIIDYQDKSAINRTNVVATTIRNVPLMGAVFTSDKGIEGWNRVSGEDFFKMYGKNISFNRHGQPLLQAAVTINAGAELLCKRLVADDAKLANVAIIATVASNDIAEPVDDETGAPTPATTGAKISFRLAYADDVITTSAKDVYDSVKKSVTLETNEYLLYVISDNGRGVSNKRIRIEPDYRISKALGYTLYTLYVTEDNEDIESMTFSINPNMISSGMNISLKSMVNTYSTQLKCYANDADMDNFVNAVRVASGLSDILTVTDLYNYDLLFGKTYKGDDIANITFGGNVKLNTATGITLDKGSNGKFSNYMADTNNTETYIAEFEKQGVAAFDGTFDSVIFNKDQYKLFAIVDANYPEKVKKAIEDLVTFREDFGYFRDMGIGLSSLTQIIAKANNVTKSKFCFTYAQSYDIIDPYTRRQITVTIGYDLVQCVINQFNNSCIVPLAGIRYKMIIQNAIYGTLSFAPTKTKTVNEKEKLSDAHINYASYIDNMLVLETEYTSQEVETQWSFINNILGIQEVIRAVRTRCPSIRYGFNDGDDLTRYKADVNEVLYKYSANFKVLEMEYVQNAEYSANKIFYAVIKACYRDFTQTEYFVVTAISSITD